MAAMAGTLPIPKLALSIAVALGLLSLANSPLPAEPAHGRVQWTPAADEAAIAAQFRLPAHAFDYSQQPVETFAKSIKIFEVTFPSPVVTPEANNNTVHCEYFRSLAAGRRPA